MAAETPNQLGQGDEGQSYGLRADGMLFKKGIKESGARFNIMKNNGALSGTFEGYNEGDVVGCGLMIEQRTIFFTLNGNYLGVAFKDVNLGLKDQGSSGKASKLIEEIDGKKQISGHIKSDFGEISKNSCNLYAAVCLQVQGDSVKCNFGAKPFVFDLESHIDKLRFEQKFSEVRSRPVKLKAMYALVKDYLIKNAFTSTLSAIERDYLGQSDFSNTNYEQEEKKELQEDQGLTLQRKMTIDFGEQAKQLNNQEEDKSLKEIKRKPTLDEISDASRS